MENNREIQSLNDVFDFSDVPSWYVLCTNSLCPLRESCLRYLAGVHAPESKETATCVMPKMLKDGECRWYDKKDVVVYAVGFQHLYDRVRKMDYTSMRKTITTYLHGVKRYYEYMRGDRPLSPEQQQWIRNYVRSRGYDWDVDFDSYYEGYEYHQLPLRDERKS